MIVFYGVIAAGLIGFLIGVLTSRTGGKIEHAKKWDDRFNQKPPGRDGTFYFNDDSNHKKIGNINGSDVYVQIVGSERPMIHLVRQTTGEVYLMVSVENLKGKEK